MAEVFSGKGGGRAVCPFKGQIVGFCGGLILKTLPPDKRPV